MTRTFERGNYLFLTGVTVGLLGGVLIDRLLESDEWRLYQTVRRLARETFVEQVDDHALFENSLHGMIEGLDRHSRFYSAEDLAALDRETSGEFRGIGIVFRQPLSAGQILFPFPGSPAETAGVRVGDQILAIDGVELASMQTGSLQGALQRSGRETLLLGLKGLDGALRDVTVRPESVVDPSVRHERLVDSEHAIGYLAILSFSHRTPNEFDAALARLERDGAEQLIIDLRGNPGGILESAVAIANRFVPEGPLVLTQTRDGTRIDAADPTKATHVDMPVVLLVDRNSASASEVLAGCLQDYGAALLVGEPTYGKGTVQTLNRIEKQEVVVKLTTATYFTPLHRRLERGGNHPGLAPDVALSFADAELARIYRYIARYPVPTSQLGALREWETSLGETLLPEPPTDRALDLAVALLGDRLASLGEE